MRTFCLVQMHSDASVSSGNCDVIGQPLTNKRSVLTQLQQLYASDRACLHLHKIDFSQELIVLGQRRSSGGPALPKNPSFILFSFGNPKEAVQAQCTGEPTPKVCYANLLAEFCGWCQEFGAYPKVVFPAVNWTWSFCLQSYSRATGYWP